MLRVLASRPGRVFWSSNLARRPKRRPCLPVTGKSNDLGSGEETSLLLSARASVLSFLFCFSGFLRSRFPRRTEIVPCLGSSQRVSFWFLFGDLAKGYPRVTGRGDRRRFIIGLQLLSKAGWFPGILLLRRGPQHVSLRPILSFLIRVQCKHSRLFYSQSSVSFVMAVKKLLSRWLLNAVPVGSRNFCLNVCFSDEHA